MNVLEDFLEKYTGVLLLVSHDRYLVDKLTDQLFIFDGTGKINIYNGNYADFKAEQELLNKQLKAKEQPVRKKLSYKEQKEYEDLEKEITSLEQQISEKTEVLSSTTDHIQLVEIAEAIKTLESKLEEKTERWLLLAELAE